MVLNHKKENKINFWVDEELKNEFDYYIKNSKYDNKSNYFRMLMKSLIEVEKKKEKLEKFSDF